MFLLLTIFSSETYYTPPQQYLYEYMLLLFHESATINRTETFGVAKNEVKQLLLQVASARECFCTHTTHIQIFSAYILHVQLLIAHHLVHDMRGTTSNNCFCKSLQQNIYFYAIIHHTPHTLRISHYAFNYPHTVLSHP